MRKLECGSDSILSKRKCESEFAVFPLAASKAYEVGSPQSILNLYASSFETFLEDEKNTLIIVKPKILSVLPIEDMSAHMSGREGMKHLLGESLRTLIPFALSSLQKRKRARSGKSSKVRTNL